jgi:REP element-mobilizing transposase RayT
MACFGRDDRQCAKPRIADHVHMMIAIPPKYSVSRVIGSIKGKSAIFRTGSPGV